MENKIECPSCSLIMKQDFGIPVYMKLITTTGSVRVYECPLCKYSYAIPNQEVPNPKLSYIIIRAGSNKIFTSEKQAITVAEKLARENPTHTYQVAELISETQATNPPPTMIEVTTKKL